ncbi:hypothetical protein [Curtobacterium sp. MCJR17_043]|uniref:glycosyl hydrolase 2 galactose-binding domain-containing protein n=1 Tax=Curtobacterium sp. MCJR17_043 TaxID=2175660 RepID=UPI0024DF5F01|nr:hypothetical protein [Curtobacterium sp. MCJR17_043]WIB36433.1 hypothetical protein DEJ15_04635 [Curtobacterium sp. MCJR17_043]
MAELSLDGVPIATTRNMHRRYRFDLRQVETSGPVDGKELEIAFESPYREAERVAARAGSMPGPYDEPFPYVRKMASNFGWDWGADRGHERTVATGRDRAVVDRPSRRHPAPRRRRGR